MKIALPRQRPFLTGLLLGLTVWLIGYVLRAEGIGWMVAPLFIGAGVVLAAHGDGWRHPAWEFLAAAGATMLLTPVVIGSTATQDALGLLLTAWGTCSESVSRKQNYSHPGKVSVMDSGRLSCKSQRHEPHILQVAGKMDGPYGR